MCCLLLPNKQEGRIPGFEMVLKKVYDKQYLTAFVLTG